MRTSVGIAVAALLLGWSSSAHAQNAAPPLEERARSVECLTLAIVYEAGYESVEGQEAVAEVVLNRVRDPAFPKTVCDVVFAGSTRRTGCQFSFTCDGSLYRRRPPRFVFDTARAVAEQALSGLAPPRAPGATHYHADYVSPYWAPSLARVTKIGRHIFYRSGGSDASGTPGALLAATIATPGVPAEKPAPTEAPPAFAPWGLAPPSSPAPQADRVNRMP